MFVRHKSVERKIKSCRKSSNKILEFKKWLVLDAGVVTCDEQDIISALQVAFEGEIILTQHCIKNKRLDAFLNTKLEQKLMNIIIKVEIMNTNKVENL